MRSRNTILDVQDFPGDPVEVMKQGCTMFSIALTTMLYKQNIGAVAPMTSFLLDRNYMNYGYSARLQKRLESVFVGDILEYPPYDELVDHTSLFKSEVGLTEYTFMGVDLKTHHQVYYIVFSAFSPVLVCPELDRPEKYSFINRFRLSIMGHGDQHIGFAEDAIGVCQRLYPRFDGYWRPATEMET